MRVKKQTDFSIFGPFQARFESLYCNAGKIRELLEQPPQKRTKQWRDDIRETIYALDDAITILR